MKKLQGLVLACALAGTPFYAMAGKDTGLYVGGSFGNADVDYNDSNPDIDNFDDIDFSDDDTAWKGFVGFNLGLLPMIDLAVEAGYVDFGSQEQSFGELGTISLDADALSVFGLAGFNIGPVGLFGKVGVIDWDSDVSSFEADTSDSGTDPAYGVGAKVQLGSFAVRAEYEMFDLDDIDVDIDYYSIGVAYTF